MNNMKKFLISLLVSGILSIILFSSASAGLVIPELWRRLSGGSLVPVTSTDSIGSSTQRISKLWVTDIDALGGVLSLTSLSAVAPITYNNGTGAFGFNYATAGSFTGLQTFSGLINNGNATTTSLTITGLTGLLKSNGSASPLSVASAGVDYENPLTFTYPLVRSTDTISSDLATTTSNTWSGTQTFATASTTNLFVSDPSITVGTKKIYPRWNDRMSIPSATSTDETLKFGSCLESSGPSVTISKIDTHIASTTGSLNAAAQGIAWNLNIANTAGSSTPMTAFSAVQYSQGTSTIQSFVPNSTVTIPSGYCYWWAPTVASTTQIEMLYFNIFGYEN